MIGTKIYKQGQKVMGPRPAGRNSNKFKIKIGRCDFLVSVVTFISSSLYNHPEMAVSVSEPKSHF